MKLPLEFSSLRETRKYGQSLLFLILFVVFIVLRFQGENEIIAPPVKSVVPVVEVLPEAVSSTQRVMSSVTSTVFGVVTRVVDGDTADVLVEGMVSSTRIRLLGINTPESVDPRRPVQCFGKEASRVLKEWIQGERVMLVEDPQADDRDKYGRWLRTIVLEDETDVNATLVLQGYAQAYVDFPMTKTRRAELRALQRQAEAAKAGLWNEATCAGESYK